ncbi:hypothetical protein GCM10020369_26110 [Cryptosporangium minutisporangium]|uniref:Transposase n=1 Tax=Cryptosporangium minutisporangium TaxID=113569 RepID=A0ABP6SWV1_9ACTN
MAGVKGLEVARSVPTALTQIVSHSEAHATTVPALSPLPDPSAQPRAHDGVTGLESGGTSSAPKRHRGKPSWLPPYDAPTSDVAGSDDAHPCLDRTVTRLRGRRITP